MDSTPFMDPTLCAVFTDETQKKISSDLKAAITRSSRVTVTTSQTPLDKNQNSVFVFCQIWVEPGRFKHSDQNTRTDCTLNDFLCRPSILLFSHLSSTRSIVLAKESRTHWSSGFGTVFFTVCTFLWGRKRWKNRSQRSNTTIANSANYNSDRSE